MTRGSLRCSPKLALVRKDGSPLVAPVRFVMDGDDPAEFQRWATAIGGRYLGAERAEEFGRRNAVPGELLVRVTPTRVTSETDVAGYA